MYSINIWLNNKNGEAKTSADVNGHQLQLLEEPCIGRVANEALVIKKNITEISLDFPPLPNQTESLETEPNEPISTYRGSPMPPSASLNTGHTFDKYTFTQNVPFILRPSVWSHPRARAYPYLLFYIHHNFGNNIASACYTNATSLSK